MISDFFKGAGYVIAGFKLITKPKLRKFVILPLLINALLFGLGLYVLLTQTSVWVEMSLEYLPTWLDWLSYLIWPFVVVSALILVFFTFTPIAILISSPFNGYLSAAAEQLLTNVKPTPTNEITLRKEIWLTIKNEWKKLVYFAVRALPLLVLYFIPVVNFTAPVIWFMFSAWMMAVAYIDYPFSNRLVWFDEQQPIIKQHRFTALGFGTTTSILTFIPLVNFVIIPAAVCGATKLWVETIDNQ